MLKLLFLLLLPLSSFSQDNLIGGFYSTQADASVARVSDATSPVNNPAGLAKISMEEISSSASSFNANQRDSETAIRITSSANHVSMVRQLGNFNAAFMVYTLHDEFNVEGDYENIPTSEDLTNSYSKNEVQTSNLNFYVLSFAPKGSKWGLSFIGLSSDYLSNFQSSSSEFSLSDTSKRKITSLNVNYQINTFSTGLALGFQEKFGNFKFGVRALSPFYILSNSSTASLSATYIIGNGTNDAYIATSRLNSDIDLGTNTIIDGNLRIGAAYEIKKHTVEFDVEVAPAGKGLSFNYDDKAISSLWDTFNNTYTEDKVDQEASSSYTKATVTPSFGYQFNLNSKTNIGVGALYKKSDRGNEEGTNVWRITGGFSKSFKNYLGSFTAVYTKAQDAGGNYEDDLITGEKVKVDLSYADVGVIFSGSYFF